MIDTAKGDELTLEGSLTEAQKLYKGGARHIYEAIAEAMGPFVAGDGTHHAHYIRCCTLVERAASPIPAKGKRKPFPNLKERAKWEDAIAEAITKAPARDLEVAKEEAVRQQALEGQRKAEAERKKQDAAKKKAAPKKTKQKTDENEEENA